MLKLNVLSVGCQSKKNISRPTKRNVRPISFLNDFYAILISSLKQIRQNYVLNSI